MLLTILEYDAQHFLDLGQRLHDRLERVLVQGRDIFPGVAGVVVAVLGHIAIVTFILFLSFESLSGPTIRYIAQGFDFVFGE